MELYERVRHLRTVILNNMSQSDFAEALSVSRDEINNLEGNRLKKPAQKKPLLLLMCSKFGISEDWLLDGRGEPCPERTREEEIAQLVNEAIHGPSSFKKSVIQMICTRSDADLAALESALKSIYENLQKK